MALHDNIQRITLDFNNPTLQTLRFHQYDKDTRFIIVTCMEYGKIVKIDKSTIEARVKWAKPDGSSVFNDETINDVGTITIKCTEQMLAAPGYAYAEIMFLEKETEKVLHTMSFKAVIKKAVFNNDTVTSSYEFDALNNALIKVKEAEEIIAKFPEWEQAENNRKQAEAEREIAEAGRELAEAERERKTAAAIDKTNTATDNANNAANTANTAASNANKAADRADTSAENANRAADRADQSANDANIALSKMNDKLVEASTAITNIKNTEQSVKDAESLRVSAENTRVTEFNEIKQQFLEQKNDANNLITSLDTLKTSLKESEQKRNDDFNIKMAEADNVITNVQGALSDANKSVEQAEKANKIADETIQKFKDLVKDYPQLRVNQSVISATQPEGQEVGDLWFVKVTRE